MIQQPSAQAIEQARQRILCGDLVAFPTETVYGLGARADSSEAVKRIYQAKGRPASNPSIVHAPDAEAAFALARAVPEAARRLAAALWPGPLTLVLPRRSGVVAEEATAFGDTIALRVPAHPVALALLRATGVPLAAPSANRSMDISPTSAQHVLAAFGADLLILDGGRSEVGIESVILDLASEPYGVLRLGQLSMDRLASFGAFVDRSARVTDDASVARSPGSAARHYAPRAAARLVARAVISRGEPGAEVALLLLGEGLAAHQGAQRILPIDADAYARGLYAALFELDATQPREIWIEEPPEGPAFAAVRDRLRRATQA